MNHKVVPAEEVESALDRLPVGAALVICSPDGISAAEAASSITGHRVAVFAGTLTADEGAAAASEMAQELFGAQTEISSE